jgi:UDP-2,4-diacetamido-2,4,6-trideoxy-beta-L-altropyranose hydrolase
MMNDPLIVFVCAGTPATGAGHLSRCLALAEIYRKEGWRVGFVVPDDSFAQLFATDNAWHVAAPNEIISALRTIAAEGCDLLVIDDYARDEVFESDCREFAKRIIAFDDQTGRRHSCDTIVDAAASNTSSYRDFVGGHALVLAGPKYALIRTDILKHRNSAIEARRDRAVHNILVSFGATDPWGLTLKALDAIAGKFSDEIKITVALSSRGRHLEAIRSRLSRRIHLLIDADMGAVIAASDIAVGSASVGAFERAAMGLPGIAVTAADNQRGVARLLVEAGASLDGGKPDPGFESRIVRQLEMLTADVSLRNAMAMASASLIDGRAASRIQIACAGSTQTPAGTKVRLRAAEFDDAAWLFDLQQEPATRRFARNPAPPTVGEHRRWLSAALTRDSTILAIVEVDGVAAGTIRLDTSGLRAVELSRYEITIAVSTRFHGCGVGSAALRLIREMHPGATFDAYVLPENAASLRLFMRAEYVDAGNGFYRSVPRMIHVAADD